MSKALTNGAVWNVGGSSTMTSLTNNASSIVFSAPVGGAFKTITTANYVGVGGLITLNAVLGPTGDPPPDRLVINGGAATGTTLLKINNIGGAGALTTGGGIPLVVVANGGTTAAGSFQLSTPLVVGGYQYVLTRIAANPGLDLAVATRDDGGRCRQFRPRFGDHPPEPDDRQPRSPALILLRWRRTSR